MNAVILHKMLEKFLRFRKLWSLLQEGVWLIVALALSLSAFTWNHEAVFFGGEVYYTDGDCYSRMTRVRMIEEGGLRSVRHHEWENFPEGTTPHTTMPLDALIAGLSWILSLFSERHLALAGAWISPLLGLALVLFLALWSALVRLPYRRAMVFMLAASPILAHGFQVGRPDHQSLLVLLIGMALTAEIEIWKNRGTPWRYVSAASWALALWVSLFEPLILFGLVLIARGVAWFHRGSTNGLQKREASAAPLGLFLGILTLALWLDGWRAPCFHPAFPRWALNIGELRSSGWYGIFSWCGWLLAATPVFLVWRWIHEKEKLCGLWTVLLVAMTASSLYHARWGYFLALVFTMSLPWALKALRKPWIAWTVLLISLWPVAAEWDRTLYPSGQAFRAHVENMADAVSLREAALSLHHKPSGGVVAPWWFCPAIVWWSGQPCVGGTSHQSLPGIVDTCEFFLGEKPDPAFLRKHKVAYVFAYETERIVSNSEQILGRRSTGLPLAERLYEGREPSPEGMEKTFANRFFKVYRVAP
ncbi:MAG: hypothetical protein WCG66_05365 [bacterium]